MYWRVNLQWTDKSVDEDNARLTPGADLVQPQGGGPTSTVTHHQEKKKECRLGEERGGGAWRQLGKYFFFSCHAFTALSGHPFGSTSAYHMSGTKIRRNRHFYGPCSLGAQLSLHGAGQGKATDQKKKKNKERPRRATPGCRNYHHHKHFFFFFVAAEHHPTGLNYGC